MALVDIILIIALILGISSGYRTGFVKGLLDVLGIIVGVVAALTLSNGLVGLLTSMGVNESEYLPIIIALIIFIVVMVVFSTVAEFLRTILKALFLKKIDGIAGAVLGLVKITIFISVFFWISSLFGFLTEQREESKVLAVIQPYTYNVYNYMVSHFSIVENFDTIVRALLDGS
ncbi:CvpA family protein [Peijinzhouia sedimentorum]